MPRYLNSEVSIYPLTYTHPQAHLHTHPFIDTHTQRERKKYTNFTHTGPVIKFFHHLLINTVWQNLHRGVSTLIHRVCVCVCVLCACVCVFVGGCVCVFVGAHKRTFWPNKANNTTKRQALSFICTVIYAAYIAQAHQPTAWGICKLFCAPFCGLLLDAALACLWARCVQAERQPNRERGRKRDWENERQREGKKKEGLRERERKRENERERERKRERERERQWERVERGRERER